MIKLFTMNGRHGLLMLLSLSLPSRLQGTHDASRAFSTRRGSSSSRGRFRDAPKASSHHVAEIQTTPHLKRKLGQHLLITESILTKIVDAAALPVLAAHKQSATGDGDTNSIVRVLEIGPGTGNLTSALLQVSPHVHVHGVEYDTRMVARLNERFAAERQPGGRLSIENADFESFQFASGRVDTDTTGDEETHYDACVANIPYQLSSIIMSRLCSYMCRHPGRLQSAVLLVQEEFALRLLASPGTQNYSRLSVNTALVADVTSVVKVGRHHFLPPPKVDSRVIKVTPKRALDALVPVDADEILFFQRFDTLLRIAFLRKNKTLRAALLSSTARSLMEPAAVTAITPPDMSTRVEDALDVTGLTGKRAVQIPVDEFVRLMEELARRGVVFRPSETRHFRD